MGKRMIEESRKRGFYRQYRQEFEFAFSKLYYMNTLFTYMIGMKHPRLDFLKLIAKGMQEEFPDFQRIIHITRKHLMKNRKETGGDAYEIPIVVLIYYKLLYGYRKIRGKV